MRDYFLIFLNAALRELFRAKLGYPSSDFSSGELTRNIGLHQNDLDSRSDDQKITEDGDNKGNISEEVDKTPSEHASLVSLNDAADEFFDVPEPSDYDQSEADWSPDFVSDIYSQVNALPNAVTRKGVWNWASRLEF